MPGRTRPLDAGRPPAGPTAAVDATAARPDRPTRRRHCRLRPVRPAARPSSSAVARLGVQAAEALDHAHAQGVVHRDIKPANLLLDARGDLWVTDFGLARFQDDAGLTLTGDLLGTLRYMSPEQALAGAGVVDHRTDIYSLGADALRAADAAAGLRRPRPPGAAAADRHGGAAPAAAARPGDPARPGDDRPEGDGQGAGGPLRHGAGAGRRPAAVPARTGRSWRRRPTLAGAGGEVGAAAQADRRHGRDRPGPGPGLRRSRRGDAGEEDRGHAARAAHLYPEILSPHRRDHDHGDAAGHRVGDGLRPG